MLRGRAPRRDDPNAINGFGNSILRNRVAEDCTDWRPCHDGHLLGGKQTSKFERIILDSALTAATISLAVGAVVTAATRKCG